MARLANFDIGDAPIFTCVFRNRAGVPTDPTDVVFKLRDPEGVETTYTYEASDLVARADEGVYEFSTPTFEISGVHFIRAVGFGAVAAADEDSVNVIESGFEDPL
jgi:hypothetical protein